MTTNYDPIAEQYKRAKRQPWRAHIELAREREAQHALGIESAFGREFWSVFLDHSPITFIECVK
jgi:hypothetical protein